MERSGRHSVLEHGVFVTLGIVLVGMFLFPAYAGLGGVIAAAGMMFASRWSWITVILVVIWWLPLWVVFLGMSSKKLDNFLTRRERYTRIAAFTFGGSIPWWILLLFLAACEVIHSWRLVFLVATVPLMGYTLAGISHHLSEKYYNRLSSDVEGAEP